MDEAVNIDDKYIIVCENLVKIYKTKDLEVLALQGLELLIEKGEMMAIIGNSGSGKSTLLNMIGGLDRPSAGKLFVDGKNLFTLSEKQLVEYKKTTVGFVWQNNARNLIPYLTAIDNVMMPMQFTNSAHYKEHNLTKKQYAMQLLEMTGIGSKAKSRLSQLSGGEQQRVAIALSLANAPSVLLADEPTGSVDVKTSDMIMDVLRNVNRTLGTTVIIVTHDRQISKKVNRVVAIRDGKTSSEMIMRQSYVEQLAHAEGFLKHEDVVSDEFAVLDRAGRVQIPREMLDQLELTDNKIKVEIADGQIIIKAPTKHQ